MAQEAPIIIHFKVEDQMLTKLLNDTHYRNLFETGVSNGNKNKYLRSLWEVGTIQDHVFCVDVYMLVAMAHVYTQTSCMHAFTFNLSEFKRKIRIID